jgi:hypothetical protein
MRTVAKDAVRKHFEIPGCKADLITEKSPALKPRVQTWSTASLPTVMMSSTRLIGCFATATRSAITEAGHHLVHSRTPIGHAVRSWSGIACKSLPDSHRIVQLNPFELPIAVDKAASKGTCHVHSNGRHLQLLREGDRHFAQRDFAAAKQAYLGCISLMRWMPEPRLRMALCSLHGGDPEAALRWLDEITGFALRVYGAADPDPVEWAVRIVALLCFGASGSAISAARQYPRLEHLELARARWLCASLQDASIPLLLPSEGECRASLHVLGNRSGDEWLGDVCLMFHACGQYNIVRRLRQRTVADRPHWTQPAAAVRASPWSRGELSLHAYVCSQLMRNAMTRFRGSTARKAVKALSRHRRPHQSSDRRLGSSSKRRNSRRDREALCLGHLGSWPSSARGQGLR